MKYLATSASSLLITVNTTGTAEQRTNMLTQGGSTLLVGAKQWSHSRAGNTAVVTHHKTFQFRENLQVIRPEHQARDLG